MKVHELISELQNYPMEANVYGNIESTIWNFNGEYSEEIDTISDGIITKCEKYYNGDDLEVKLS